MQENGAYGGNEERIPERFSEQFEGCVHITVAAERIHVHADVLPFVVVPDRGVAYAFCSGSRNSVPAGSAVAGKAGFAFVTYAALSLFYDLVICHYYSTSLLESITYGQVLWPDPVNEYIMRLGDIQDEIEPAKEKTDHPP